MASIAHDPGKRKRVIFVAGDGRRVTIRIGKVSIKDANSFKTNLENLIDARKCGSGLDAATAQWIARLDDRTYGKLQRAGLLMPKAKTTETFQPKGPTLAEFLNQYVKGRIDVKSGTQLVYGRTCKHLLAFFGREKRIAEVTKGGAQEWRLYLIKYGLADNTVRRTCGIARQFFAAALDHEFITKNPFKTKKLKVSVKGNEAREYFLSRQDAEKILEACPDAQWRLLFALARYGGLRTPSEILLLRWVDVDWDKSRFRVHSLKTAHHEGKESRLVPIFPELYPHLLAAYEEAEPGTEYVITRYRKPGLNLRTQLMRILRRAELEPWPKLWQNLRATRQTELSKDWPEYIVCAWMGNSKLIAREHYLQVTEAHFKEAARKAAQYEDASSGNEQKHRPDTEIETPVFPLETAKCGSVQDLPMGDRGLEPLTSCV